MGLWLEIMKKNKVVLDEKNRQSCQKEKRKVFYCVLKILCWWSLKSKKVKYWCLKMENLCALMGYLISKIIFFFWNTLLPLILAFSFPFFYLTLTLAPLQQKNKIF